MKYIICFLALCGLASGRPQSGKDLTRYDNFNDGVGNFRYVFQINDEVYVEQNGNLKEAVDNTYVTVMNGLYSVSTPENIVHEVRYVADENGYRPHVFISRLDAPSAKAKTESEPTTVPVTASSTGFTTSTPKPKESHLEPEKDTATKDELQPQAVLENTKQNQTDSHYANRTIPEEFPDRIGTPVIITLQGAPG